MPALVRGEAQHKLANFGSEVWLELSITDLEVLQKLFCQGFDVVLVHQGIYKVKRPPATIMLIGWVP